MICLIVLCVLAGLGFAGYKALNFVMDKYHFIRNELTHIDKNGRPRMVNVGDKADTKRIAIAKGSIYMSPATLARIKEGTVAKGDVLSVAQTAGIMAAKNTSSAIPM